MSPKTTFMTPADITGEPEIKIAAPTVSSVLGTSKAGYLIKGTAEPNRIIQISNRLLRSVIAVGATDAEGNFAIQLTADKRLLNKVYLRQLPMAQDITVRLQPS